MYIIKNLYTNNDILAFGHLLYHSVSIYGKDLFSDQNLTDFN